MTDSPYSLSSNDMAKRPQGKRFKSAPYASEDADLRTLLSMSAHRPSHMRTDTSNDLSASHLSDSASIPSAYAPLQKSSYEQESSKKGLLAALILIVVLGLLAALVYFVALPSLNSFFVGDEETIEAGVDVSVTIPEGASGDTIASLLSVAHVIEDPQDYYAAVEKLNAELSLQPGEYIFHTLQDPESVVKQLMAGPNGATYKLTIPEGLTVAQTAAKVEEAFGISADEFISFAKASSYVADYPFLADAAASSYDSLEGYLCPKTYSFTSTPTTDEIIRTLLDQYELEYDALDFEGARTLLTSRYGLDLSDYELLIMASIVEREALTDEQRVNVASTFYNRLCDGMALQSDATLMYETGGEVTANDLSTIESPYNTYKNTGLTPTPVCSPSINSLEAALSPADTSYFYFFITTEGAWFSETYDQHLAVIEEHS